MNLNTSRHIVSLILEIVIAICTMTFLISVIMTFTVADKNFFINQFATMSLAGKCDAQLNAKYEVLSSETGIPARVFERVEEDYPTDEALRQAALSVFSEENETLYSENKVNYFYELSIEYLNGNGVSYNKADVKRAAQKAARIYSDTVGLHNTGGVDEKISDASKAFPVATIASFVVVFICFPSVMIMYKRKKGGYFTAIGGLFAGAVATIIGSGMLILFSLGSSINIMPEVHNRAIVSMATRVFLIVIFFSVVLAASSFSAMKVIDSKIQDED